MPFAERAFKTVNYAFLALTAFVCIVPMINVLAISFSASSAAAAGYVKLWPIDFTLKSYEYALAKPEFVRAFFVSVERVALGFAVNLVMCICIAYPLSRETKDFKMRNAYSWFFVITMMFGGGLIPTYMVIRSLGLMDSIWALVLPNAVPVFNVVLLMNFFRELPKEIEEAAFIDGANHWTLLFKIFLPLSKPALATISLFVVVGHWNGWFDGLIYMNSPNHYPMQSYLRSIMITPDLSTLSSSELLQSMGDISDRTLTAAQIFLAALPVLSIYPFLQKYFMKGLVLGSVKG